ncbi:MAG: primosomal protein N' [Clostridia bacterium]|nr:primosomal protein N' [Clostridia bacterium]
MCTEYIRVHILDVPYQADWEYTYFVPIDLRGEIEKGSAVVVPFGKADRRSTAVVTSTESDVPSTSVKSVISVLSGYFKLSQDMLELCSFMKLYTLCTFGEAVKCIIPSAIVTKTTEAFRINEEKKPSKDLSPLYELIKQNPNITFDKLKSMCRDALPQLTRLLRGGSVIKETLVEEKDKSKYETLVSLCMDREIVAKEINGEKSFRSKKHPEILALLCEKGTLSDKEIYDELDANKSHLDALEKKGYIKREKIELSRDPYAESKKQKNEEPVTLSPLQTEAFNTLKDLYYTREPKGALLYGVTGSGKTSVIKKMIDEVIKDKRGVIILVPEISLTPQTVSTFCGYYGERVAVIHSSLSKGERFDTYKKIYDGEADIVIGTRSAIFAPVKNLGLIVIDEEQEHTYKSDTNPKYLAHDIARFRVAKSKALMLLASATPSLNSYYKAMEGKYTLVKMMSRYGEATLPDVVITDMRKEKAKGNMTPFGTKLADLLDKSLKDDKQGILFLNRRGYHSSVSCGECGKAIECPNCSVAMTYHSYRKIDENIDRENASEVMSKSGILKCHYCGYRTKLPDKCKECGFEEFDYVGFGTQKAESELAKTFEGVKTLRLDADTTGRKSSYERILGDFKNKKADILIGTQMVTKGHNFPKVTVVGVLMADTMLYTSDYRASERTFSMLTQVIGRAGRAKDHGVAVIQTNSPNDQAIVLSAKQDYDSFYENEIQIRKAYEFPPFCDIAMLTMSSTDEKALDQVGKSLIKTLEKEMLPLNTRAIAYGPFEAPVYKTQGRYRKRIIVKCVLNNKLRGIFSNVYIEYMKKYDKVTLSIDFNPSSI